jgi:acyl-CoA synthetase (NDP forming)
MSESYRFIAGAACNAEGATPMDALMKPSTIAVVGATNKRVTRGNLVLKNIRAANYEGKVYAVHPNYDEIEGFPCYPAVSAIPVGIDSVVAAIPAPGVAELLEESFAAGVRGEFDGMSSAGRGHRADHNTRHVANAGAALRYLAMISNAACIIDRE